MPMSDIPADQHEAVEKAWKLLNLQADTMLVVAPWVPAPLCWRPAHHWRNEPDMSLQSYWLVVPLIIGLAVRLVLWLMRPRRRTHHAGE